MDQQYLWNILLMLCSLICAAFAWLASPSPAIAFWHGSSPVFSYYVANEGSDSNPGTLSQPWQTIAHVNAQTFTSGQSVGFKGGETFSGALVLTTNVVPSNFTIGSYDGNSAMISSGAAACIAATDIPGLVVSNITCVGAGDTSNSTPGISIVNNLSGNQSLAGPTITQNTVSGYGGNGIEVKGTNGTSGFSNLVVSFNMVHDTTANVAPSNPIGTSCIYIYSTTFGSNSHSNATVNGNVVFNCPGLASQNWWTGSGILVSETNGAIMSNNVAHDFGANNTACGGPVGIWAYDATGINIEFSIAYNGTIMSGCDGGGFDLDGGVTNSFLQYNLAYANSSYGYLICQCSAANSGNTVRYNISANNNSANFAEFDILGTIVGLKFYNNTVYTANGPALVIDNTPTSILVSNNIFSSAYSGNLLLAQSPANVTIVNNDYYGSAKFSWNGTSYTSVAAWQAAGGDASAVTTNPNLTNPGGTTGASYKLQAGSAMIGAGLDLTHSPYNLSVGTQDYFGDTIPNGIGTGYNIGADGGNP